MASIVQNGRPCGHCGKEATEPCPSCHGAPGYESEPMKTNYCNAWCQLADEGNHRISCKELQARKKLYRVGDTIQQVFYLYEKNRWAWNMYNVVKIPDTDDEHENSMILFLGPWNGYLQPFPEGLLAGQKEKESVLAHLNCHDSIVSMHEMVESVLLGSCSKIEEVTLEPKNGLLKVIIFDADGEDLNSYRHELFRITTNNGEMYAFDLTSAQYGYHEPMVPWELYDNLRVGTINKVRSFGDTKKEDRDEYPNLQGNDQKYGRYLRNCRRYLNIILENWQASNMDFSRLLTLPDQEFVSKRRELFTHLDAELVPSFAHAFRQIMEDA